MRPPFLMVSLLIAILLMPFVSHAAWDRLEMGRVNAQIDAVLASNEPIAPAAYRRTNAAGEAERLYLEATLAVSDADHAADFRYRAETFDWSPPSIASLRVTVRKYETVLSLLDRAARLPFQGFAPGANFGPGFSNVVSLAGARAAVRAADGDGDAAIDSIASGIQAGRTMHGLAAGRPVLSLHRDSEARASRT